MLQPKHGLPPVAVTIIPYTMQKNFPILLISLLFLFSCSKKQDIVDPGTNPGSPTTPTAGGGYASYNGYYKVTDIGGDFNNLCPFFVLFV